MPKITINCFGFIGILLIFDIFVTECFFSLKRLAAALLMKVIQESANGHSSVEDATTTMELFKELIAIENLPLI